MSEQPIARLTVASDRHQVRRLLAWAEPLGAEWVWAVESANGLGHLLSQQLLAAGEQVVDVPAMLAARVRLLGTADLTLALARFTPLANVTGLPALSLPVPVAGGGFPSSLQLIGPHEGEDLLVATGAIVEHAVAP